MFAQLEFTQRRSRWSRAVSIAAHCLVLYALLRTPKAIFVTPSYLAWGQHGRSNATTLTYLAQRDAEDRQPAGTIAQEHLTLPRQKHPQRKPPARPADKTAETATAAARAGSPFGSLFTGPIEGHDVRPAIPTVFPDPMVYPWQIPKGVQGNVIVEITIDAQGNVTDMKVLQALGYGIEDKVLAALRQWRFRPALLDGRAIASQQDVHFRFPS